MEDQRIPCKTKGCTNTIQPATAKRNNGYCGPCMRRISTIQRQKYIEENKREVDLYSDITDPVEILKIFHEPRRYDPLIIYLPCQHPIDDIYSKLTHEQASQMMDLAVKYLSSNINTAETIAQHLGAFTDYCLDSMLEEFILNNAFYCSVGFRNASNMITSLLIQKLNEFPDQADGILVCLAWIGSDEIVNFLKESDKKRSKWSEQLYIKPSKYAHEAGWEIRSKKRYDLFHKQCFAIKTAGQVNMNDPSVKLMQDIPEKCQWCGRQLTYLITLDKSDTRFSFLHNNQQQISLPICLACSCYTAGPSLKQTETGQ